MGYGLHTGPGIREVGHRLLIRMGTKEVGYRILTGYHHSSPLLLNGKASSQETGLFPVHSQQCLCRSSKGTARNAAKQP